MKYNCDISYREMNSLINTQNKLQENSNRPNPYKRCPKKFRKAQGEKKHIQPISLRGLVCDISDSESLSFRISYKDNDKSNTRSISIRGEDGNLYNFITSYKKNIDIFKESLEKKIDVNINAYINSKLSNKNVKRLCSAGHSYKVNIELISKEE